MLFVFIPCTKSKAGRSCTAREMYAPSAGFRGAWAYAQAHCATVVIFSAKYGALSPDHVIDPYDATLIGCGRAARERWTAMVMEQLDLADPVTGQVVSGDQVVSFLPRDYGEILHRVLRDSGVDVQEPLRIQGSDGRWRGMRPGERLAWFRQQRASA